MHRRLLLSFALMGVALRVAPSRAQPADRPLTIVIPFATGGASDVVVRRVADALARELGRAVIAENKGGAGGLIAAAAVGRAQPDGATLLYGNQGQMTVAPLLFQAGGPDPRSVLMPLTQTARTQFFLVVPSSSAGRSVTDLVQAGRRERLRFGVPGIGSPPHLAAALFGERAGIAIDVVAYQGSSPMLVDLIAGRLDAAFDNVASSLPHVQGGKLHALGVSGEARVPIAPQIPTLSEGGLAGYGYTAWQGLFAPAGTPAQVAARLVDATHRALADAQVRTRLQEAGVDVVTGSTAEFEALIARDAAHFREWVAKGVLRPA